MSRTRSTDTWMHAHESGRFSTLGYRPPIGSARAASSIAKVNRHPHAGGPKFASISQASTCRSEIEAWSARADACQATHVGIGNSQLDSATDKLRALWIQTT